MKTTQFGKNGWTPERIENVKGKTYLITGTTSGTGFEAAKILLSKGAKVVMLNRNPQKSDATIATLKQISGWDRTSSVDQNHHKPMLFFWCNWVQFRENDERGEDHI
jgi:NAD(P)-dependent dehydrogenase (short-subunit alcohol dehydrogenase family)